MMGRTSSQMKGANARLSGLTSSYHDGALDQINSVITMDIEI